MKPVNVKPVNVKSRVSSKRAKRTDVGRGSPQMALPELALSALPGSELAEAELFEFSGNNVEVSIAAQKPKPKAKPVPTPAKQSNLAHPARQRIAKTTDPSHGAPPSQGRKSINLALQGGGAHGAFAWGAIDALLADGRVDFEAVSATSAGAMNAVVLAEALTGWQ